MKKIAYLVSEYPAVSHTFIFREIRSLRKRKLGIVPFSVNAPRFLSRMTEAEKAEAKRTRVLKQTGWAGCAAALCSVFLRSPLGFLGMALKTLSFCFRGPKAPLKAIGYLGEAVILIHLLKKEGITHIHEHFANPTALVALLAKVYGGFTYSLSVHGPDVFYRVDTALLGEKVREALFVRCIGRYCRSQLWRMVPHHMWGNFHIVSCGVDTGVYTPAPRKQNGVPKILCVGRLTPAKGQHLLLEACALIKRSGRPFHLTLVGDGEDRKSLENLAAALGLSPMVTFAGALGQDEVMGHYREADLFVLPSFAEGIPVVLMEAMALGIPVVATRITGIPELIEDGRDGLLATPGSLGELADRLHLLLEDKELGVELGRAAVNKVRERYDGEKNDAKLAELFERYGEIHVDR